MNFKKILSIIIFFGILISTLGCLSCSATDLEKKKKETRAKINHLKWLESVETTKLYKNQQKLEKAQNSLNVSQTEYNSAQKDLSNLQGKLAQASAEYNNLNFVLSSHIRMIYKRQRIVFFAILLRDDNNVNKFVDNIYYQKIILRDDFKRMNMARNKAIEIATLQNQIKSRSIHLQRSMASINSQQADIQRVITKNKNMISKLRTDRVSYEKAEKELARQSASIGSYINRTAKDSNVHVASGFIRPIQGRITSPFGWRTHPIFNSRSFHSGVDIGGPNNGSIRASNTGKVIYAGWYGGYGKVVIVEHGIMNGKPVTTLYAHMSTIKVSNGQRVNKGDVLGLEGTTGYSTGPHCHFEVRVNGQPNNPMHYIN